MNNLLVKAIPLNKEIYGNKIIGYYLKITGVETDYFGTPRRDENGEYSFVEKEFVYCEEYNSEALELGLIEVETNSVGFYVGDDCEGNRVFVGDKIEYANKLVYRVEWDNDNCKVKLVNLTNNIQSIGFNSVKEFIKKCRLIEG